MKKLLAILVLGLVLTFSSNGMSGEMNVFKKKIILNALITMNIEEKRNLGLKSSVGGVEIEPFK